MLMWWPGAKIRGCYSALMKHLPADLINSSKHFTFSGVIATEISNLASTERLFDGTADSAGLYNLSKSTRGFRALIFTILCGNGEYYTALIPVASVVTNIQLFYISNTVYVDYADMWYNSGISVKFENDISFTVVNQYHKTWLTPVIAAVDGLY